MKSFSRYGRLLLSLATFGVVLIIPLVLNAYLPYHLQYILSFLGVLPAIWVGIELTRFVRSVDELQQRLVLEALALGLANTVLVCFAIGMLQPSFHWEINMVWVLPIAALFCGAGYLYARVRYHEK